MTSEGQGAVVTPPAVRGTSPRPSFLALRDRPDAIQRVRRFAGAAVFGLPYAADEIELRRYGSPACAVSVSARARWSTSAT
jgi:hypothetical protein